jgi:hypothetical protein
MSKTEGEEQPKPARQLICDFNSIEKRLSEGKESLDWLEQFIDQSASIYDYASRSIRSSLSSVSMVECRTDSCQTAIQTIAGDLISFSEELTIGYQMLEQELLDSSQRYRDGYAKSIADFRAACKAILKELSERRKQTEKEKEAYFKSASQLEKAQKALETTIESIENGNFAFSSMIEPKTSIRSHSWVDEVLVLRQATAKQEMDYKKAIETTNNLIISHIASYNSLVERVLQVEQGRVATIQTLMSKHLRHFERLAKSCYEKAIQANLTLTKINSQEDVGVLSVHKRNEGMNKLFVPMQFIQYDSE